MLYTEKEREIPVKANVDVLVVGSGPAGIAAAVAAARGGARVLLIESQGSVGGVSTTGLMSHFTGSCDSNIYHEILKRSAEKNEGENHGVITTVIDPEKLKTVYLEMLEEAGVQIRLYTFACEAICEGNQIIGVVTESKSGREAFFAKVVIDASGDGDIAAKAGAEYSKGREGDGRMQPVTLMFKVGGVDTENAVYLGSFESTYQTEKGELQALAKEHIPFPAGHVLLYKSTLPGIVTCNMTNCIEVDGTKAEDLTKGELVCRKQLDIIVKFLREFVPGYENCFIISSASVIGVRETRHFKGLYTLTEADILKQVQFPDYVVKKANFNFDVHNITGAGLDKTGVQKHFPKTEGYFIPYRCLIPEKIDNLILSGRNISGTHIAHSNFRAMPICVGIGEAGGYAAAIACKKGISVRNVDAKEIQKYID